MSTWKAHFPEFWPRGNIFETALTGITPGDVALLDLAVGRGVRLSTGVFVLYCDDVSFTLMTPQGHMFAGWITCSAEPDDDAAGTAVQAQVLMRASDPLYELAMPVVHRKEDQFWIQTMTALGRRLGTLEPQVRARTVCIDPRRQWRKAGNIWQNAMVRSLLQTAAGWLTAAGRKTGAGRKTEADRKTEAGRQNAADQSLRGKS
jgi:hypothetical protein